MTQLNAASAALKKSHKPWANHMKIFEKRKSASGRRKIYICGMRVLSYKKKSNRTAQIEVHGQNNQIKLANRHNPKLRIYVNGNNNLIDIRTTQYFCADINIGFTDSTCSNCKIIIESDSKSNGINIMMMENDSQLTIGQNCLFSSNIMLWCSDTHTITDMDGNITNIGHSIEIGNHCWIGMHAKILKNTKIPDDSIVGMGSIVTKKFETPNSVYAGNPAKLIKTGVQWSHQRPQRYIEQRMQNQ